MICILSFLCMCFIFITIGHLLKFFVAFQYILVFQSKILIKILEYLQENVTLRSIERNTKMLQKLTPLSVSANLYPFVCLLHQGIRTYPFVIFLPTVLMIQFYQYVVILWQVQCKCTAGAVVQPISIGHVNSFDCVFMRQVGV